MSAASVAERVERERLVAIVRVAGAGAVRTAVRALLAAGIRVMEVSLAAPGALDGIRAARGDLPSGALLGAGTVRSIADAERALAAGADFLVSPHADPGLVAWARERDVLHVPGALTPTEVAAALDAGAPLIKLFPAGAVGPGYVRDLLAPFPEARLVPTGGVTAANAGAYLEAGAAAVAVGSSLVSEASVREPRRLKTLARSVRAATLTDPRSPESPMTIDGILPVIPTPLRDGAFDAASFGRLLDHMLPHVDGYTLLGSTGEAPSLTTGERMEIAAAALEMTPQDKRVVVGISHTSLPESVELAQHAQRHGAAAVLFAAPYYFPNSRAGLGDHLAELGAAIDCELVFYDNPAPNATPVSAEQILEYASRIERLNTVKLTDHGLDKVAAWRAAGLRVLGGDDPILFRYLDAGVDGMMVIAPAIFPAAFRETWDRFRAGDAHGALDVFSSEILPFLHVFGIGDEIVTTKGLLAEIGIFSSEEVRLPLVGVDPARRDLLARAHRLCVQRTERRLAGEPLAPTTAVEG